MPFTCQAGVAHHLFNDLQAQAQRIAARETQGLYARIRDYAEDVSRDMNRAGEACARHQRGAARPRDGQQAIAELCKAAAERAEMSAQLLDARLYLIGYRDHATRRDFSTR